MRDWLQLGIIGLAAVLVALMAVGYSFIFRGVATAPDETLGRLEVPPRGEVVAAVLDDGTPVFVVNPGSSVAVLDARAPVAPGTVPALVAWCEEIGAFETGPLVRDGDMDDTLGFDPDGRAFGLFESPGLTRHAVQVDGTDHVVVLGATTQAGGRIGAPPICPAGSDRLMHRPAAGEVFDPSVAVDSEPPGVIWLEGTLRAIGNQALLCDQIEDASGSCPSGAVARGIDPARVPDEGTTGLFIGRVRDGALEGLVHALVLSEVEES